MLAAFLLAFPALFSIVNPVGGAFIFREATAEYTHAQRVTVARRVGVYSLLVMMVALWAGSYVLAFFGITIGALRIAGGLILSGFAWERLGTPEKQEGRKRQAANEAGSPVALDDVAFYPLTLPFTTGPGTIAVSVALGAGHPGWGPALAGFFGGVTCAALAMAVVIALTYSYADRLGDALGQSASRTISRLSAFLLFAIGVQMFVTGVTGAVAPLLDATGGGAVSLHRQ